MAFLRKSVVLKYFFNNVLNFGKHTTKDVEQSKILMKYSSNVNLAHFSSMSASTGSVPRKGACL